MIISVSLAVLAFVLVITALFYDLEERRFRFSFWDGENRRFRDIGRFAAGLLVVSLAVVVFAVVDAIIVSSREIRAVAEAEHQMRRMTSVIGNPEVVIIAEFTGAAIRAEIEKDPGLAAKLNGLLLLAKETPIPPDACAGILIAEGGGAISDIGDLFAGQGGLSPVDFFLTLGFYRNNKDISQFAKSGFELFDMLMSANFDAADVELTYVRREDKFRLVLSDEGDGFSADPLTVASSEDLLSAVAVVEAAGANSAFERGYVKWLGIRDRANKREFGVDFSTLQLASADSGWPAHSFVGDVRPAPSPCPRPAAPPQG
jgi:hypothetical protein